MILTVTGITIMTLMAEIIMAMEDIQLTEITVTQIMVTEIMVTQVIQLMEIMDMDTAEVAKDFPLQDLVLVPAPDRLKVASQQSTNSSMTLPRAV